MLFTVWRYLPESVRRPETEETADEGQPPGPRSSAGPMWRDPRVVPFLIYTIVLVVVARVDLYLLWMWIPTVTAGVLVGSFLDLEHRRRK